MTSNNTFWKEDNSSNILKQLVDLALDSSLPLVNLSINSSSGDSGELSKAGSHHSIFIKLILLFILTIVVLLVSYRFVVSLFSGYLDDKKDDSSDFYIGIRNAP
ncbi:hypothetical protein ACOMHN_006197 [Nucella lapillus]